jgi:hypothetical protein
MTGTDDSLERKADCGVSDHLYRSDRLSLDQGDEPVGALCVAIKGTGEIIYGADPALILDVDGIA